MRALDAFGKYILASGAALALLAPLHANGFSVLYTFTGGSDGGSPLAGLIKDKAGNLYGTTQAGGAYGHGTVFKLAPDGTETVLYSFAGGTDGGTPWAGLIKDKAGNLYGTTLLGGLKGCVSGCGTVFKLAPDGTETVLHSFTGSDGEDPYASLTKDSADNLYGTTALGGTFGIGTVFKLTPDGTETVLHSFVTGGSDGAYPWAGLMRDASGTLYGTTQGGGAGGGTVFKVATDGTETVLFAFTGKRKVGGYLLAGVIKDKAGNFYSTTFRGGTSREGTVFKLAPDGTETVLHSFTGSDGALPVAGLIKDAAGNLYGTTDGGGANEVGTVFRLAPDGSETVLHSFTGSDGQNPYASLIEDTAGNLYGTASTGGTYNAGVIFKLKE